MGPKIVDAELFLVAVLGALEFVPLASKGPLHILMEFIPITHPFQLSFMKLLALNFPLRIDC